MSSPSFATTAHVRENCLCLLTQRAARSLARRFNQALRPLGLTNGQFSLLMALNRREPPAMFPVAELLAMDRTSLTAMLKPLTRRGLVSVTPDPDDGRTRLLHLTDHGRALLARALPIWKRLHAEVDASLNDPGRLRRDLQRLA